MSSQEKTEKATPKKRQDERKKGNVFQSKDIVTVGVIAISFYLLKFWVPYIYKFTSEAMIKYFGLINTTIDINSQFIVNVFVDIAKIVASSVGIIVIAIMIVCIAITGSQTKFLVSKDSLKFKMSKLNPLKGLKRMVSLRSLVELVKNILKISIIGFILYKVIYRNLKYIPQLMNYDIKNAIHFVFKMIMSAVNSVIIYFLALAVIDYLYQWWEYEKNIKMSKQDVKDEYKNTEGNPEIKGKIKDTQRKMSMSRMMQQVPQADVIIRNPTHFAIAIKYDEKANRAPIVIAKGQDYVAKRIIEKAMENKIYMIENRPLARALYNNVEINQEVPFEYYEQIAEILAWVYKLKEKRK
ncbi:flagellar biosynthesis protein FlhB [Sedimentibacter sp. zth1]|uniref:flagellar biosynthesis protein FlhB n=1 Tax=Sedimentibacter sp. zth1 TaxID=2816908 RepID=UPI001A919959|nr:flagellar biosynthesis protein FlhB [Sedimentibacter sp. zth1]QSX07184.1 flagellar biosynthesis protein FlhB [Sedimentibacter sp. zth1]